MEVCNKSLKQVLLDELDDLKFREKMMEAGYKECVAECSDKIAEIQKKKECININIDDEAAKNAIKMASSMLVALLVDGLAIFLFSKTFINFGMTMSSAYMVSIAATFALGLPIHYKYLKNQYKKSMDIVSSYKKDKDSLSLEEEKYEKMMESTKSEYLNVCNLVIEKEHEIAEIDNMTASYGVEDSEKTISETRPLVRKLVKKED